MRYLRAFGSLSKDFVTIRNSVYDRWRYPVNIQLQERKYRFIESLYDNKASPSVRLTYFSHFSFLSYSTRQLPTMDDKAKTKKSRKSKKMKKSGVRTKFLIESLRNDYYSLREENEQLRNLVKSNLPPYAAEEVLATCYDPNAPKAKVDNVDALAGKMAGASMDDDDEDAVGF